MINITLSDGKIKAFTEASVNGSDVARSISDSLLKKSIAVKVNGVIQDMDTIIADGANVILITAESQEGLEIIRHDAAHVLAQAVKELFSNAQVVIGPVIENGFFYDFAVDKPFTNEDLVSIENKMREIISRNERIQRKVLDKQVAIQYFESIGEHYKVEIIKQIADDQEVSVYWQGEYADLCRGPHAPVTGFIKALKLMKVSGSYWRGDSANAQLQRIYGTAWATKKDLEDYLQMLEEAEKRDHRKIGKEMDLFHFQEEAPGAVFWHPKGWKLFQTLLCYIRDKQNEAGYLEINTPEIMDKSLWEKSGHWEKFSENMYTAQAADEKVYAVRPMNCPGGIQVFNHGLTSYRDLPLKLSEFGKVHRYEPSGALHGLMRVRAFTQDDAHIFCTEDQLQEESVKVCQLVFDIYRDFGFQDVKVKFATRPEKRIGSDEVWDQSEAALLNALQSMNVPYSLNIGEGAFYGPKLEFVLRDAIGRDWQLGTLQVDLNLPVKLEASYIGKDGHKHYPVMLHRALFGSLERFIGILIEHYSGHLPLWISPVKIVVLTITSDITPYAEEVYQMLKNNKLDSIIDTNNETLNYKVKKYSLLKIPVIVVLGRDEAQNRQVSVRRLGDSEQIVYKLDDFLNSIIMEVENLNVKK